MYLHGVILRFAGAAGPQRYNLPASVFLLYDDVITLGREVDMFWHSKLSGASALFFANRYITLLCNVLVLVEIGYHFSNEVRVYSVLVYTSLTLLLN